MKQIPHPQLNPYEQNRKQVRWEDYDYARSNVYYVTMCTHHRLCYFGDVHAAELKCTHQGCLADVLLIEIPYHFPIAKVLDYVVMPDHIHLLISIDHPEADEAAHTREINNDELSMREHRRQNIGNNTLSSIIRAYKTAVSYHCHRLHLDMQWQRGFYEHIVRDEYELRHFKEYIDANLGRWNEDRDVFDQGWPV